MTQYIRDMAFKFTGVGLGHFGDEFLDDEAGCLTHRVVFGLGLGEVEGQEWWEVGEDEVYADGFGVYDREIFP